MATVYLADTPSRVLRRVQQMEDMELPSLPSFQHDLDYDTESGISDHSRDGSGSIFQYSRSATSANGAMSDQRAPATPHPSWPQVPLADHSFSTTGSPFPPVMAGRELCITPSPNARSALTSTPFSQQSRSRRVDTETRSTRHERTRSGTDTYSSNASGQDRWQTPAEMSGSFSGDEILDAQADMVDVNGSFEGTNSSPEARILGSAATPRTDRLSDGNILLRRPGKRATSNQFQPLQTQRESSRQLSTAEVATPSSVQTAVRIDQDRIPSLSRTEASENDTSGGARTPEAQQSMQQLSDSHIQVDDGSDHSYERPESSFRSPSQVLSPAAMSTPRTARGKPVFAEMSDTPSSPACGPLREITANATPFTPSPSGLSKLDITTPRAPLDDAQRRKNHVLAVLSSTMPKRIMRTVRGTPHPLRRVSTTPTEPSIIENSPLSQAQTANGSFVSIASSADLTSDKRATHVNHRSGNVSVPNLLLPNVSSASPGGSLKGISDHRADGIKIHRHLNAMNKQLLETNADLARESEIWRTEVDRLHSILADHGVNVKRTDVPEQLSGRARHRLFLDQPNRSDTPSQTSQLVSAQDLLDGMHPEEHVAVLQEMAERLETLEIGVSEKDALIADLETKLAENPEIDDLTRRLEEAEQARSLLHSEFTAKTELHARRFGEICSGFEEQVHSLEKELAASRVEADRLRVDKPREQAEDVQWRRRVSSLEIELKRSEGNAEARNQELESQSARFEKERQAVKLQLDEGIAERSRQHTLLESVRAELVSIRDLQQINAHQEAEVERLNQEISDLAGTVEDLESKSDEVERLSSALQRVQKALETAHDLLETKEADLEALRGQVPPDSGGREVSDASMMSAIHQRLDEAYHEIGRLKHELAATPHRKSGIDIRDARISALERERAFLVDRLASQTNASPVRNQLEQALSPFKPARKAIVSLRTPKTPGPLRDLSWLQTTIGDINEPLLRDQVEYLQDQLKDVNDQLDSNFSRLEAAGLSGVELAERLAIAHDRISELDDETRALVQRNKASLALVTAQRDGSSRESEQRLKQNLQAVHNQISVLKADMAAERARLSKDNRRLEDLVSETTLKREKEAESFRTELQRLGEETDEHTREAQVIQSQMMRDQEKLKKDFAASAARVRQLERDLAEQLQANEDLQTRRTENAETESSSVAALRSSLAAAQVETKRLRESVVRSDQALRQAEEQVVSLQAERQHVVFELAAFETDLKAQKVESQGFGEELQRLKSQYQSSASDHAAEVNRMKQQHKAVRDQLGEAVSELDQARNKRAEIERWRLSHDCSKASSPALEEQQTRFKAQSRELATQIRYLKAKFTRESTFRNALTLQKRYLLLLVGGMSLNEQATLKQIASMGYPVPQAVPKRMSLRSVGLAIISTIRAQKAASQWKAEVEAKTEGVTARGERRGISIR